jgi:Flp pilus assembly protein TadG
MSSVSPRATVRSDERGAVIVEFAVTLPLLLLVLVGILDFGFVFQQYEVMTNAAREGARMAVLPGYANTDVQNRVAIYLTNAGISGAATTTVTPTQIALGGGLASLPATKVTVQMNYTFKFLGPIAQLFGGSFGTVTLSTASEMRTEVAAGVT